MFSINSLLISIDIISDSFVHWFHAEPAVYAFFSYASPGYNIIAIPVNLVYPPARLGTIHNLETSLTD